uniref:Uncharacterized protein n=1 Tax=Rhodopseudomonas palustris (strain BisA53) TaxID=316055 RepID=Q07L99_RHOP5
MSARHQIKRSDQDVRQATVQSKDGPAGETVFLHSVRIIDPRFHRRVSARVKFDHDVFADPLVFCGACRWQGRASSQIISPEHLLIQPARRAGFRARRRCTPVMRTGGDATPRQPAGAPFSGPPAAMVIAMPRRRVNRS